jgi:hypothetical protein
MQRHSTAVLSTVYCSVNVRACNGCTVCPGCKAWGLLHVALPHAVHACKPPCRCYSGTSCTPGWRPCLLNSRCPACLSVYMWLTGPLAVWLPCPASSREYTVKAYLQLLEALRAKAGWLRQQDPGKTAQCATAGWVCGVEETYCHMNCVALLDVRVALEWLRQQDPGESPRMPQQSSCSISVNWIVGSGIG